MIDVHVYKFYILYKFYINKSCPFHFAIAYRLENDETWLRCFVQFTRQEYICSSLHLISTCMPVLRILKDNLEFIIRHSGGLELRLKVHLCMSVLSNHFKESTYDILLLMDKYWLSTLLLWRGYLIFKPHSSPYMQRSKDDMTLYNSPLIFSSC